MFLENQRRVEKVEPLILALRQATWKILLHLTVRAKEAHVCYAMILIILIPRLDNQRREWERVTLRCSLNPLQTHRYCDNFCPRGRAEAAWASFHMKYTCVRMISKYPANAGNRFWTGMSWARFIIPSSMLLLLSGTKTSCDFRIDVSKGSEPGRYLYLQQLKARFRYEPSNAPNKQVNTSHRNGSGTI